MVSVPDTWSEVAKVAIAAQAGSDVHFDSLTETVDIDIGDKDFDVISTLSGGRLIKFTPQEPTTITLEAYPVQAGTNTGTTGTGFFDLVHTVDTSQPIVVSVDRVRSKYRIAIMWTNDVTSTTYAESQVVSPTYAMLRVVASDGYFTSVKPSFTDGVLKFTVVYKVPPFDKSGVANIKIESLDGSATATLTALASYTSSTKW
jgi:hypothetical protein